MRNFMSSVDENEVRIHTNIFKFAKNDDWALNLDEYKSAQVYDFNEFKNKRNKFQQIIKLSIKLLIINLI